MSDDDESARALRYLREHPYEMSSRVIDELLALSAETRHEYLAEHQAMYCEETRGECLLKLAASRGQFELAHDFVHKVGFEIRKTQVNDYNLVACVTRGSVELVELFASKIGTARDCLKAWMTMEPASEAVVEQILEILLKYGLVFDRTKSRILHDSLANNFSDMTVQTRLLYQKGIEYRNDDVDLCALRKAAIWGKVAVVDLFLTNGSSHSAQDAANGYELLQIGVMRSKIMQIPLDSDGLKYFRKAQAIRDAAHISERDLQTNRKCFSSIDDIVQLEQQINDNHLLEFVNQCYALCTANNFSSEPYSDPLAIYDLQTWMFFYLDDYQDILSLYLQTELEPRRFFHNKYKSAIARLLLECHPATWQQYVMIFHTLKSMTYQSNTAVDILRGVDLDVLKAELRSADFPSIAGYSLLLSYVVDIMQFTVVEVLLEYVSLLLELGADVSLTAEEYRAIEAQMENSTSHPMWWLPSEELGVDHGNVAFHPTTMHRILCSNSVWLQSNRYKLLMEKIVDSACCQLDAGNLSVIKRRQFGVLRLKCLAAKKCPRSSSHRLPTSLAFFIKKHR